MHPIIVFAWFIFAFWTSSLARKRARNPYLWFVIGFLLGIFGVLIAYFLKPKTIVKRAIPAPVPESLNGKLYFYLKEDKKESSSMSISALKEMWKNSHIDPQTYIWCEEWTEWKRIKDIPDLLQYLTTSSPQ